MITRIKPYFCSLPKGKGEAHASETHHRATAQTYDLHLNDALQAVDLLVMPTLPMKATRIPPADAPREERVARALEMIANTCPFDVTGHPAMTIPCGLSSGLPVGMMLVGKKWNDATVLRAAHAFEQISGYTVRPQQVSTTVGH